MASKSEKEKERKRQRSLNSSNSELDVSTDNIDNKDKKPLTKKQQKKKTKMMEEEMKETIKEETETLSQKIDAINIKLNNILTKDDTTFIKLIITETLQEMKAKIIGTVEKRVEIIESELHDKAVENEKQNKVIEQCKKENMELKVQLQVETESRKKQVNELEQYGRRNNLRISGLSHDDPNENAEISTEGVLKLISSRMGIFLNYQDIDIAHRLGRYKHGSIRPVIVKFVHRNVKMNVMRNANKLKNSSISINEDLTQLNQKVLASLRIKGKATVVKSWSYEGKLFAKFENNVVKQLEYKDYAEWLSLPWPKKHGVPVIESTDM